MDLAGDVALEATHDVLLGLALCGAAFGVGAGFGAVAQAADGDEVQGSVGLAVAAGVEAVAAAFAGSDGDRACAAERGERALALEAVDVLAGGEEQLPGVTGGDPQERRCPWGGDRDQWRELRVALSDLVV